MTGAEALGSDALRAFAVFADHRNFTAAAAVLHISQPSLHVKINKLAANLGVDLYSRHGREIRLTAHGLRLAAFARDAQRRVDGFLAELDERAAPVAIAAGRGALLWVLGDGLRRIADGGRELHLRAASREAALTALTGGHVDVAVIAYDPPPSRLSARQIATYPQILAVRRGHPLARRRRLTVGDLQGADLALPPSGRAHRRAVDRALLDAGVQCRVTAEVDGWALLVHVAGLGLGAAIVNGCVELPPGVAGIPITDLPPVRYWAVWQQPAGAEIAALLAPAGRS